MTNEEEARKEEDDIATSIGNKLAQSIRQRIEELKKAWAFLFRIIHGILKDKESFPLLYPKQELKDPIAPRKR